MLKFTKPACVECFMPGQRRDHALIKQLHCLSVAIEATFFVLSLLSLFLENLLDIYF